MRSLAKKHQAKVAAKVEADQIKAKAENAIATKTANAGELAGADYEIVNAQLKRHLSVLEPIDDVAERVKLKKVWLPDYVEWLNEYLAKGENYQNEVLSRICFWLIDTGDMPNAFKFCQLAIEQQQIKPEGFKRDLTTALVETIHDWCEVQFKAEQSAEPFLTDTCLLCLSGEWIVIEIVVLSKLYRLRGLVAEKANDYKTAVEMYEHCMAVNPEKHGVKTRLQAVKAKLKKQG